MRSNPPQTLSGIETLGIRPRHQGEDSSNPPQTLSGIETARLLQIAPGRNAPTHPKPSQGLKRILPSSPYNAYTLQPTPNPLRD